MDFEVEHIISPFIESQFPEFYKEHGSTFVLFVKAYYEWLELEGNIIHETRELMDYRDVDNTKINEFLSHFQQKYLYGIPYNIIVDKQLLLKHTLDVYRSKGSINSYKLLFKLIYNEDIEVYVPSYDMIKPSDGTWIEPKYLEVINPNNLQGFSGKTIVGISSGTTAVVESSITESINDSILTRLFLTNILPFGSDFIIGEKIVELSKANDGTIVDLSPTATGSFDTLKIINGGYGFKVGDVLSVAHRDPTTNEIISNGIGGKAVVNKLTSGVGAVEFSILYGGVGYNLSAQTFVYRTQNDNSGSGAKFAIDKLSSVRTLKYNTDLITDYADVPLNSYNFKFPGDPSANISSNSTSHDTVIISSITNNVSTSAYNNSDYIVVKSSQANGNSKITFVTSNTGSILKFNIATLGFGFDVGSIDSSNVFVVNSSGGTTTAGNNFVSNSSVSAFNIIADYMPAYLGNILSYETDQFGTIQELQLIDTGSYYIEPPYVFAKAVLSSNKDLPGKISFNTACNVITGTGTYFTNNFSNGDVIKIGTTPDSLMLENGVNFLLMEDNTVSLKTEFYTEEFHVIKTVSNNTSMQLYGAPNYNTTEGFYRIAPSIIHSNYSLFPSLANRPKGDYPGENAKLVGYPATGNSIVAAVSAIDSGKAYAENEVVQLYLYNALSTPEVANTGSGYSNGDIVSFIGGSDNQISQASGYVKTDRFGHLSEVVMTSYGSGYQTLPKIVINSKNGSGGILETSIVEYNPNHIVIGRIQNTSIGRKPGYWSTSRGMLNADKYIQDSYFYQDFSYQLKVAKDLETFKNILYDTFHTSGSEMFAEYYKKIDEQSIINIEYEDQRLKQQFLDYYTVDRDTINVDDNCLLDKIYTYLVMENGIDNITLENGTDVFVFEIEFSIDYLLMENDIDYLVMENGNDLIGIETDAVTADRLYTLVSDYNT